MNICSKCLHDEKEHDYQGQSPRGICRGTTIDHIHYPCKINCKGFT